MKKTYKPLLLFFLCTVLLLNLPGCSLWFGGVTYGTDFAGNSLFQYDYQPYETEEIRSQMADLSDLLEQPDSHDRVLAVYSQLMSRLERVQSQYTAAYLAYNVNLYSENMEYETQYLEMSTLYEELNTEYYRLIVKAYPTEYRDIFFAGLTEDEAAEILTDADSFDEEYLSLMAANDAIYTEYYDIEIVPGESDKKVAELYAKTVINNNRIAKKFGYAHYFDYAYKDVYGREYSPKDVEDFLDHSIAHLIPALEQIRKISDSKEIDRSVYDYYYDCALEGKIKGELDLYFESLGEGLNGIYHNFHEDQLFVSSSDDSRSYEVAYTDYFEQYSLPVCYFGPYYQDRLTVVHELGHFARAYLTNNAYQSYDAAELNSQGNEMLFLAYESTAREQDFYGALMTMELGDRLADILLAQLINRFEYAVYTAEQIDGETVLRLLDELCEQLGGAEYLKELLGYDVAEYWQYVVITQPAYYISYAISGVSALELYTVAMEDYSKAVEMYWILVSDPTEGLLEILPLCGLSDPFSENTFKVLSEQLLSMDFLQ